MLFLGVEKSSPGKNNKLDEMRKLLAKTDSKNVSKTNNESAFEKEQKIFNRLKSEKEITKISEKENVLQKNASEIKLKDPQQEKNIATAKINANEKNTSTGNSAFEKLRMLSSSKPGINVSEEKTFGNSQDKIKKNTLEIKEALLKQKAPVIEKNIETKKIEQISPAEKKVLDYFGKEKKQENTVSIEKNKAINTPTKQTTNTEKDKAIAPIANENTNNEKNKVTIPIAKKEITPPPTKDTPEEVNKEKTSLDWLKREIIEEPKADDFTEKTNMPTQTTATKDFDWMKETQIDKPSEKDFGFDNESVEENESDETSPKWKKDFVGSTKTEKGPKWIINSNTENNAEKTGTENGMKKEEIKAEEKSDETGVKWKHEKDEAFGNENKKDSLSQADYKSISAGGNAKWKLKPMQKEEIEIAKEKSRLVEDQTPKEYGAEIGADFKTPIDIMFELLTSYKKVDSAELARASNTDFYLIEKIAKLFENYEIVEIKYPTSLNKKPMIVLKNEVQTKIKELPKGKVVESYEVKVDFVPAKISIIFSQEDARPVYCISIPSIGKYTRRFLDFVKSEIAENMPIELDEIIDPKKSKILKDRFFVESKKHLKDYFPTLNEKILNTLSGVILHEMYGLGDIELILGDDMLEEVAINSAKTPITIYHRIHGWLKTNLYPGTEEEIMNYASQIGRKVGREITNLAPILDAHLLSGDRVNATLFPVSAEGNTLTIRRFARKPWTIVDFIGKAHTMDVEMAALLWLAMQYELNVVISGGTASGKTSALNTLLSLVPSYHRLISIEDVREIVLPKFLNWNWIPMVTRSANPEGLGELTMLDCMVSSLRMRPDRIIVGEIRRKREAEVLMEAIETGHSIYSTIHANSSYQVLRRLAEAPMSIPLMQIELIDLIIVQFRDRKTNRRRTFEISEIEQTSTGKGLQVNTIYKWVPRSDSWEKLNKPTKLLTLLNMHTGLTEDEVNKELKTREKILLWLVKENINDLDMIGYIVKLFYTTPEAILKMAQDGTTKEQISELMK